MSALINKLKEALYKKELLVCFLSLVLISLTNESQIVEAQYTEDGRPFIVASPINILSPSNITYNSSLLTLNVTFKLLLGVNCVELSYSIDGHDNITITPTATRQLIEATITYKNGTTVKGNATFVPNIINGWAALPKLAEGSHKITVYTRYNANNIIGLDKSTSYFTIDTNLQQEIPEFPGWIILPFFVVVTLFVIVIKRKLFQAQKIVNNYQLTQNYKSDKVFRMGLGWDSVLRLAAVAFILLLALQIVFFFIFQNIGYDSKLLGIALTAFILMCIIHIILRRITAKKFPY